MTGTSMTGPATPASACPAGDAEHADRGRDRDRPLEVVGREGFSPWACATQPSSLCSIGPGVLTGGQDAEHTGHLPLAAQLAPRRYRELAWRRSSLRWSWFSSPLRPGRAAAAVAG